MKSIYNNIYEIILNNIFINCFFNNLYLKKKNFYI